MTDSHVRGKAATANPAAVPYSVPLTIHFDWFKDAGIIVGTENR